MNESLLYGGREQRLAAFEPDVLEELKQKEQQYARPGYVDDVLDEGITQKWLASHTGQSMERIQANAPGVIRNYFGEDLNNKQAYDRIVEIEQLARIGVSESLAPAPTLAPSAPAVAPSPAPDQNDANKVDYGDFQALRTAAGGFQESALMIPYGTFSFLDGLTKRVTGDGAEAPTLTTPDNDRYLANLAKDVVAAAQRREDIRRNAGIDPGYDAEGKAAIDLYQRTIAVVDKGNKAKIKAWVDKQEEAPFRKIASFWLQLADETDNRLGVDPAFAESSFGQFAKMAGSLPATAALAATGYGGFVAMGGMMFAGEELQQRQTEGELFNPASAVTALTISTVVQAKFETLMKWDDVFKGAFGKIQFGGRATMRDFAKQITVVGIGEGLEEPAQGLVSDTVAALTYDKSRNPLTLEALERRVWEAAAGTAGGFLMGGSFGGVGAIDQNRRAKQAGEYLTNKMGGPLNAYDFNAARAAFNDTELSAMADGATLLKAANGDTQAQKEYNSKLVQGKFTSLYGARVGTSQFGYVLTETRQMPAILEDNGTITIIDPTNKKAVETWSEALQLHKAKADLLEEETISDLIDYVRDLAKARPNTSSATVSTPQEVGFAPSLAEQANNDPVKAREIYDRYVEIGLLPAGLDPMSPDLRTVGSSQTIYDDVTKTFKTIIKIYKGADPLVVIEENSEDAIKRELATGRVTRTRVNFWRQAVEGTEAAALSTDEAAIEWVSKYTVAYAIGKAQGNEMRMPKSFLEFVQKVAYRIRKSLQLAARVLELERNGQLPADLQEFMRGALGMSEAMPAPDQATSEKAVVVTGEQQQQTDSTTAPADPVTVVPNEFGIIPTPVDELPQDEAGSAVGGYVSIEDINNPEYDASDEVIEPLPELPPELQAYDEEIDQMYGDTVTEMPIISQEGDGFVVRHPNSERMDENVYVTYESAKRAAQNYFETMERAVIAQQIAVETTSTSRDELMSAVLRIGHLIAPSQEPTFGGELRMIWNNLGLFQAMKTFRKKALELDALRQELNSPNYGFNYETVTEMLDALIDSSGGRPQYPKNDRTEEFLESQGKNSKKTFSLAESYVNENNTPESQKPRAILEIATMLASAQDESLDRTTYSVSQKQAQAALSYPRQKETLSAAFAKGNRILSILSDLVKQPGGSWDIRGAIIKSPRDLLTFTNAIRSPYVETVKILLLNSSDVVVHSQIASIGSISQAPMSRDIMRRVINAAPQLPAGQGYRVIISHNHPSGVVKASGPDNLATTAMIDTLRVLGHEFADHIITNGDTFYSYREAKLISGRTGTVTDISPAEIGVDINATAPVQWEILSRPMPYALDTAQSLSRIVEAARASSEDSMHIIYTDSMLGVVAIERIPEFVNVPVADLLRRISATATSQGATGIGVGMPQSYDMEGTKVVARMMQRLLADIGITVHDVTYDSVGADVSMRHLGLMEAPASYSPTTFNIRIEPGFHSRLSEVVQSKVQGKSVTIEQLKALINNPQAGIKAEEIKWSGINDMLDEISQASTKVEKQTVLDYLDRQSKTKFIQYTGQEDVPTSLDDLAASFGYTVLSDYGSHAFQDKSGKILDLEELPQDARIAISGLIDSSPAFPPKYSEFVLPGGENYREVVLSMPLQKAEYIFEEDNSGRAPPSGRWVIKNMYGKIMSAGYGSLDAATKASKRFNGRDNGVYFSSHFPNAPGYIAHTRINDRNDDAGNPGTFLEEVQSDRHQAGRKRGYAVSIKESDAIEAELKAARSEHSALVSSNDSLLQLQLTTPQGSPMQDKLLEKLNSMQAMLAETKARVFSATEKARSIRGLPDDAPFRKDWALQMFKRALRDAVTGGKSWIGWTTGQIQADRFDLSKQVDAVLVNRKIGGSWIINGTKDGEEIFRKEALTIDDVEEMIGGHLASKVADLPLGSEEYEFTGIDLKLGGEGMMGFYDDILPKEIGKYVKQWGARVEKSEISIQANLTDYYVEEGAPGNYFIMDSNTAMEADIPFNGPFSSTIEATNYILAPRKNGRKAQIWRVDINQQMKEGVALKGQPTFSVRQSLNLAPTEPAPVFYSRLIRTVEQSTQGKASGAQWKATIKNSKLGVNQEEFALVGVQDLEDGKTYTKQEVLDYLKANEIKVQDVTLGEAPNKESLDQISQRLFGIPFADTTDTQARNIEAERIAAGERRATDFTQFSTYVLPGAIEGSYREVLLTVPDSASGFKYVTDDSNEGMGRTKVFAPDGTEIGTWATRQAAVASQRRQKGNWEDGHGQYSGIANPIVRLRYNERVTADGKRMLFLEEVQAPKTETGDFQKMPTLFQKNWREIGFKWALRKAVEGGFDVLGWTTGQQQADRYKLSKQVDSVRVTKNPDETYGVEFRAPGDRGFRVANAKADANALSDIIGKDLAQKAISDTSGEKFSFTYENVDLNVGGEGLIKLYDSDFRNVVNGLAPVKKSGQKVGKARINETVYTEEDYQNEAATASRAEQRDMRNKIGQSLGETVNALELTDAIRESAMSGQTTFSLERAVPDDASNVVEMPDGARLVGPTTFSIKAYHGTPHKVSKFSMDKIGTGEGAQAYGWGLYFAGAKSVAEYYQKTLSDVKTIVVDGYEVERNGGDLTSAQEIPRYVEMVALNDVANIESAFETKQKDAEDTFAKFWEKPSESDDAEYREAYDEAAKELKAEIEAQTTSGYTRYDLAKAKAAEVEKRFGNFYTVDLLPDEEQFLDWDKPLSEQSDKVKAALATMDIGNDTENLTGGELYRRVQDRLGGFNEKTGADMPDGQRMASEAFVRAGIPSIRYLDAQSRDYKVKLSTPAGPYSEVVLPNKQQAEDYAAEKRSTGFIAEVVQEGTSNYVIFDENLIRILEENGQSVQQSNMGSAPTYSLSAPDPLFSTNNLIEVRRVKDAWVASGSTPEGAMRLVSQFYDKQNYVSIPPDVTLVPMPSTSGKNIVPAALAERLSQDFGNKVMMEPAGINTADRESKNKTRFSAKISDPVGFRPVASAIQKLLGVPVYIVEDVHNTGESWISFARMLQEWGVDVRGIVTLASGEQRITSPRDIDRLSNQVASILQIGIDAVRPHLDDFFNGSYRKLFNLASREIAANPALAGRLLQAAISGGYRGSFRSPIPGKRKSNRRVQPAPAKPAENEDTTFSLGATTAIQVSRGRAFSPVVRDLLRRRQEGEAITRAAIDAAIRETFPAAPVAIPTMATLPTKEAILAAIKSNQVRSSIDVSQIAVGTRVQLRQDVDSWTYKGVGVVVIHTENGNGYEASAAIDNVVFGLNEKVSLRIALGGPKTPVVKAYGTWSANQSMPADLENWTQVGFNPDRHSFYYDRNTMRQVTGADQAFQVGNTVFAKGAKFGDGYVSDITYALKFTPGAISKVSSENDASRIGTSKKGTKAKPLPTGQDDNISGDIIPEKMLERHLKSMAKYHFLPASVRSARTPKLKAEALIRFLADNLIALHNAFPPEHRARATLWYDGANRLAREIASTHNMTVEQSSAILASFSPQKDWFMNVAQAEQFASIWANSQDVVLSQEVVGGAIEDIVGAVVVPPKLKVKKQTGETKGQEAIRRAKNLKTLRRLQLERRKKLLPMLNKTIRTMSGESQAWAIRAYAQTKFGRDYRNLSPEGDHLGIAMLESEENTPAKNGWGSCLEIEKAVKIMQDGSLLNISKQLGNEHKVRSFYNNIVSPNSPYGDSTIDTHAVAAAWIMPYGSSAKAVKDNFGGASSSEVFGISGTYWIYLSAYRLAAKELGLQPRQMQSIVWEAIRLIYPSEGRNKESVDANRKVWNNSLNETEARSRLIPGRIPNPVWAGATAPGGYSGIAGSEQSGGNLSDFGGNVPSGDRGSPRSRRGRTTRVSGGSADGETFAARLQRQQQSVAQIDAEIRANLAVLQQHGTLYTQTQGLAALAQMQNEGYDNAIATAARTNKILRRAGSASAKLALPIDFRIERIIPELGRLLRQRTQQAGLRANEDNRTVVTFFERLMARGITNGMLAQLDHALFNGHDDVVDNIVRQYGAQAQLTAVRAVFQQQMNEAIELGVPYRRFFIGQLSDADQAILDAAVRQARTLPAGQAGQTIVALVQAAGLVRSVESYWPRKVMNRDALLQTLGLPGVQDEYDKLLDRSTAAATAAGRNLTDAELDALIDQANANARRARAPAGARTPGSLKARVIDVVSVDQMQFYYKGIDSAMRHNVQMRDHLETLRFFGASVVHSPSDIDFHVLPVNMSASVGAWVTEYQLAGNLSTQQRNTLMEMMVSRFNYQASPAFIGGLRSFSYLQNMTQITTWLTATIADTWTGFYDSGSSPYRYGKNFVKAMADLSEISAIDIGLNGRDLGAEFDKLQGLNPTLLESMRGLFSNLLTEQGRDNWTPGQAITRLFDWFSKKVGLPYFERVTREAHINSAVERLISQARSGTIPRKTQVKLERYFGQAGAARVVADLQAGRQNAADVQFFAFCILCDWKAVSLDQMPQGYLANPQGRVFYMYKTWIAAQFAGVYRSAGQDIASGNPAQVASGIATMLYLILLMMAVGIPVDAIVSLVQGRPFILQDSAINRMLGFIGTGRYVATLITRGEYGKALTEYFAPPLGGAITDIQDDIEALWNLGLDVPIKNLKVWRNLPIVGRVYNGYLGNKAEENRQAIEKAGGQFALTAGEQPTRTDEEKAQMKKQRLAKEYGVGSN